ncbi:hypothetical protein FB45DRAFT_1065434 [Roridomyces roridus]|uniref:F-box domain-containing protein n=1 Tax=Roridomyces roridus TaxID=1738132 RepID=A0AAD7B7F5_9AGAR|nr:hypothetical protein FB45DRAFT_1065434 [Roridomyces roridus]
MLRRSSAQTTAQPGPIPNIAAWRFPSSYASYAAIYRHRPVSTDFERGRPRVKHGDLAVLARTSRVFSVHALELLWETAALLNLLRHLPSDALEVRQVDEGYQTKYSMELLRPLRKSDFDRVFVHAARVKRLVADPGVADLSSTLRAARPWLSANGVFPMLQAVYWMHDTTGFGYIEYFLVPQLTDIFITQTSGNALAWLPTIARRCTRLEYITLLPRVGWREQAGPIISKCVRSWDAIKSLRTDIVDSAAFQYLSRCGKLRHLQLCDIPSALPSNENGAAFPSLETLYLDGEVKAPTRFLEWANGISLVDFTAECQPWTTADEVHGLFSAAQHGISHFSLKHFAFDDRYDSFDAANVHVHLIRSSSLRRLFCFTNLTSVSILSAVGVDMDDTTVTDMARSWPHIQRLELQSFYGTPVPRATLECLQAFPKYCPHLTSLILTAIDHSRA